MVSNYLWSSRYWLKSKAENFILLAVNVQHFINLGTKFESKKVNGVYSLLAQFRHPVQYSLK